MLLILVSFLLVFPCLAGFGALTEKLLGRFCEGISSQLIMGIFSLSIIWTIIAFFFPLNNILEITTIIIGWGIFVWQKIYLQLFKIIKENKFIFIGFGGIILFIGSFPPFILDHFGYYVPSLLWLKEYGLVKGISNLDLILGQMSSWHILQAGFSHFTDVFLKLNTILLLVYLIYILEKKAWIHLCFFPILFFFAQSPSPDLPVIIFSMIILQEIFNKNTQTQLILALSVFVFMIKPTMIWLPIFAFLYSFFVAKTLYKKYILSFSILLLFIIKNIWTFGYPVFPVALIDANLPWKPNPEVLQDSSKLALLKTYDLQFTYEEIQQFSPMDYIKNWLSLKGLKSVINILFIISLGIFIIIACLKKQKFYTFLSIAIVIKAVLVLAFSAQYRFFIDVFFVLAFILFSHIITKKTSLLFSGTLAVFITIFLIFPKALQQTIPSFRIAGFMRPFQWTQVYKPTVYTLNKYYPFKIGKLHFNISKKYPFNFDTPIPAISTGYLMDDVKYKIIPQPIDSTNLKKGFIWKKMYPKEIYEAEKIIRFLDENKQPK